MDDDLVARLVSAAEEICRTEPVRVAYLFGSHARGQAQARSDVDIAVLADPSLDPGDHLELSLRLARRFESAVDRRVEAVVVLDSAPLDLAGRVRRDRVVLWSNDEPYRVRWESRIARLFHDHQLRAEPRDHARLAAIAEGRR